MKIKNISILPLLAMALILSSCDEISRTSYVQDNNGSGNVEPAARKVLVEEFTGHKCGNCPAAHTLLNNLKKVYGDNMIIIAIHSGYFASHKKDPFLADYTCEEGDIYYSTFGISSNPQCLINREGFNNSEQLFSPEGVEAAMTPFFEMESVVNIELEASVSGSGKITATVDYQYTETPESYHNLVVYVVEDSIISPQEDYSLGEVVPDYAHRHVLRGTMNGAWGQQLESDKGQIKLELDAGEGWQLYRLHIVAAIQDVGNTEEVLQVEEVHAELE